jgi:hypothetical protein
MRSRLRLKSIFGPDPFIAALCPERCPGMPRVSAIFLGKNRILVSSQRRSP